MPILAGYMVPHPPIAVREIGRGEELKIQDTLDSFDTVARDIEELKPDTIILTSPHSIMYGDYFHISPGRRAVGDFGRFGARNVRFDIGYDDELAADICSVCDAEGIPAGTLGERDPALDHGTTVPMYFINKRVEQRGKFYRGDELMAVPAEGEPIPFIADPLYDENHELIDSAPHAKQTLYMSLPTQTEGCIVIRMKES